VVWNKRGNTGGGASSGRGGTKRGGKDPVVRDDTDPDRRKKGGSTGDRPVEFGDCSACNGLGEVEAPRSEVDEDGAFRGAQVVTCTACGGEGKVKK
jgi:DnaJ-class molecular chaperone